MMSAILFETADNEMDAVLSTECGCKTLEGLGRCKSAKFGSSFFIRKDGTETNICRLSEFKEIPYSEMGKLRYICGEDAFIDTDFSDCMGDVKVIEKCLDAVASVYRSKNEDPYIIIIDLE